AVSVESAEPTIPWVRIFTTRTFVSGVFLVMSCYAMSSVILTWLPSYFEVGLGYSRLQAGSMFAFPSITGLILMLLTSTIGDRLITRGVSSRLIRIVLPATGVLICGAFLLVLPVIDSPALAVLVVSLGYGFASPVFPMLNAAIS
ncbi:MFS transporter, partial [Escherichia coli]|nr:MFS transporter [Escherichia coli]